MSSTTTHSSTAPYIPEVERDLHEAMQRALECIQANQRFLVVSHERPDGDAIGSTLAMGLMLEKMGKDVTCFNVDAVPYNLTFLPGQHLMTRDLSAAEPFDVTIVLDLGERHRLGDAFPAIGWGATTVMVDHHKSWDPELVDIPVRDVSAAATGELVYQLLVRAGVELTTDIARALYCCIMTDTGGFRYASTSPKVMNIASALLQAGVEPWEMTSRLYEDQPRERLALLADILQTLTFSECGRLAFLVIDEPTLLKHQADDTLTDGFINYARGVRGVEVATQLRQKGADVWRISFRSRGHVDVSQLAERFGGGGHYNAAACVIEGPVEDVQRRLEHVLCGLLD